MWQVRRINSISAGDLIKRSRCTNTVGDSLVLCVDNAALAATAVVTSDNSDVFGSYHSRLERSWLINLKIINCHRSRYLEYLYAYMKEYYLVKNARSSFVENASSTPKYVTALAAPVRGPSHSSACASFGRIAMADLHTPAASIHMTNAESGSRHPVK